jgi:protein-S-isoprenylcysteine O-methyltransferase Ste14
MANPAGRFIRHPMYTSFSLLGLAQMLLYSCRAAV